MKKSLLFTLLLAVNFYSIGQSKLIFNYDGAGNQNQRFYCESGTCNPPNPISKLIKTIKELDENLEAQNDENNLASSFDIYPNPTNDMVFVKLQSSLNSSIEHLNVYNANSSLIRSICINKDTKKFEINLSKQAAGLYFIVLIKTDGSTIVKKIIKY